MLRLLPTADCTDLLIATSNEKVAVKTEKIASKSDLTFLGAAWTLILSDLLSVFVWLDNESNDNKECSIQRGV